MINIYYEARTMYYQTIHNSQDLHLPLEWSLILTVTTNYLDNSSRMIVSTYEHMFISKDMIIFEDKCLQNTKALDSQNKRNIEGYLEADASTPTSNYLWPFILPNSQLKLIL